MIRLQVLRKLEVLQNAYGSHLWQTGSFQNVQGFHLWQTGSFQNVQGSHLWQTGSFQNDQGSHLCQTGSFQNVQGSHLWQAGSFQNLDCLEHVIKYQEQENQLPGTCNQIPRTRKSTAWNM